MIRFYHNPLWTTALGIGALVTVVVVYSFFARTNPLPVRGGEPMPRFTLGDNPIYRQNDPRWKNDELGGSGEPFGATGCTVCCLSMALARFGIEIDPGTLNRTLDSIGGFTERGWLKWNAVPRITGGRLMVDVSPRRDYATIDRALREGNPVLVRVLLDGGVVHWVVIVGKDGYDYLMKDPLGTGDRVETMERLGSDIYAIRIVQPSG